MKKEYKFLVELCNDHKAPLDHDGDFDFRWWTGFGGGFETPKSAFVETIINLLSKKDKNFPRREFLKQVKCRFRHGMLCDMVYEKQHIKETAKEKREEKKEERKAEKERQKLLEQYGLSKFYGDIL